MDGRSAGRRRSAEGTDHMGRRDADHAGSNRLGLAVHGKIAGRPRRRDRATPSDPESRPADRGRAIAGGADRLANRRRASRRRLARLPAEIHGAADQQGRDLRKHRARLLPMARLAMTATPRVLQVVLSLNPGGTERLVLELASRMNAEIPMMVCCLEEPGSWADD